MVIYISGLCDVQQRRLCEGGGKGKSEEEDE